MHADDRLADAIAAWLPGARWSGAKSGRIEHLAVPVAVTVGEGTMLALVDATTDTTTARYVVPVDAHGHDAVATPAFARWLIESALDGGAPTRGDAPFVGHLTAQAIDARLTTIDVAPLGTDASNTSLVVRCDDEAFVVKLLRRYRTGVQPEVELGDFFARLARWDGTPRLRGWIEHRPGDGSSAAIATIHDHVPGCQTAWDRLLGLLCSPAPRGTASDLDRDGIRGLVEALGRATGRMHGALASRTDVAAFAPEMPSTEWCRATAEARADDGARILARAAAPPSGLPADLRDRLRALSTAAPRLLRQLGLPTGVDERAALIRVHGDYHLGQVLVTGPDDACRVFVIDFEGEPGRSLAERRAKLPAAKDVAGMCRSFDYALRHAAATGGPAFDARRLHALEHCFLDAYNHVAAGGCWWPRDAATLLDTHRLEKALYELDYELDHRPDWVAVPLAALEAVAEGGR